MVKSEVTVFSGLSGRHHRLLETRHETFRSYAFCTDASLKCRENNEVFKELFPRKYGVKPGTHYFTGKTGSV